MKEESNQKGAYCPKCGRELAHAIEARGLEGYCTECNDRYMITITKFSVNIAKPKEVEEERDIG